MSIGVILALIWMHTLSDFVLQSDAVAKAKSSSNKILALHVLIYSAPMLIFGIWFALANYALHFITDYFSSRATTKLWVAGERHWFFVVIGIDQAIHFTCLLVTFPLLGAPLWA